MVEAVKLKFTQLQEEILEFLFMNAGESFNQRTLAKKLNVSSTAIAKSLDYLRKEGFILQKKDQYSKIISIELNRNNSGVIQLKRASNIKLFYTSGLFDYLSENFFGATIILFGSYSFGEDLYNSDIDIAIIGKKEKKINLEKFSSFLGKKIILQFYHNLNEIHKNLRENILNGILFQGGVEL